HIMPERHSNIIAEGDETKRTMPERHSNLITGGIEPQGEMPPDSKTTMVVSERHTKLNSACPPDTTAHISKPEGNDSAVALGYDIRCPSDIPRYNNRELLTNFNASGAYINCISIVNIVTLHSKSASICTSSRLAL
ncbi:MAG: hypothetical protein K2J12_07460, partial [Muribaculaceae bacterium]|nr:hypothetical protein [Muribaculaceae bacterium]